MDFKLGTGCGEYQKGFEVLLAERGYALQGGTQVSMKETKPGTQDRITVDYADGRAAVEAPGRTLLFRGLMLLVRKLEKDGDSGSFRCEEEVCFKRSGSMVDCSRNSVLSMDAVKQYLRIQAALGMNTFMLYTEDTYEVPEYPTFGAFRGRYSQTQMKEIDAYAAELGIEVVPCIQALAHLKTALRWPEMAGLRDTDDILMVGSDVVYAFIRACVQSVSSCFRTRRIHLGMDEAWSLGLGKYLFKNGYHSKAEIMKEHLDRTMEICREFGLKPMIWSDMYFRMLSPVNEYYDVPADVSLESAVRPPEDVSLVYWDYYHKDKQFYLDYLKLHSQLCSQVVFAGGLWTWNGIAPNLTVAFETSRQALSACRELGIEEHVCTLWQDDGAETPIFSALPALIMYAQFGFSDSFCEDTVKDIYEFLTGVSYEAAMLTDVFDHVEGSEGSAYFANPSKYLLYQDVMTGLFDGQIRNLQTDEHYGRLADRLRETLEAADAVPVYGGAGGLKDLTVRILKMYQILAELLSVKSRAGIRLQAAYRAGDREILRELALKQLPQCCLLAEKYHSLRRQIWLKESNIFGLEVLDIRLSGLVCRMRLAGERIMDYLEGRTDSLPELKEERLVISPADSGNGTGLVSNNSWWQIVSASNIC